MLDLERSLRQEELYELGTAVALAFNDPEGLEAFRPKRKATVDWDKLPAMLRPVRNNGS